MSAAVNGVKNLASDVTKALDVEHNIQQLGAGDKYSLNIKANGSAFSVGGEVKNKLEVKAVPVTDASGKPVLDTNGHPKLKYTVAMDSKLAVGFMGNVKGADGKGLVGAGGKVEMSFDTAEEAARAIRHDFASTPSRSSSWAGAGTKKAQQQQSGGASQK